jgi:hypothetical protein
VVTRLHVGSVATPPRSPHLGVEEFRHPHPAPAPARTRTRTRTRTRCTQGHEPARMLPSAREREGKRETDTDKERGGGRQIRTRRGAEGDRYGQGAGRRETDTDKERGGGPPRRAPSPRRRRKVPWSLPPRYLPPHGEKPSRTERAQGGKPVASLLLRAASRYSLPVTSRWPVASLRRFHGRKHLRGGWVRYAEPLCSGTPPED